MTNSQPLIEIKNLSSYLGGHWVHKDLNLSINRGEILGIVGGSGSGKTTLLREMLRLQPVTKGSIRIFDCDITTASPAKLLAVKLLRQLLMFTLKTISRIR